MDLYVKALFESKKYEIPCRQCLRGILGMETGIKKLLEITILFGIINNGILYIDEND